MAKRLAITIVLIFILGTTGAVFASTILSVPTADLAEAGVGIFEYAYSRGNSRLAVNWGLLPQLNVGLGRDGGEFFAGLKVGIFEEGADPFGLALGAELGTATNGFYGVLSKQLGAGPGLRGHLALGTGRYKRGMAGVSLIINPVRLKTKHGLALPAASLLAAYDGAGLTAGVVAIFSPGLKVYAALEDFRSLGLGASFEVAF